MPTSSVHHFGFPLEVVIIFFVVVAVSVYLDLFAHRHTKEISVKDAALWSCFWVALALGFYAYLYFFGGTADGGTGKEWADLYLAGYALEKSLSVDNLMVFMAIFASFGIKGHLQHRILYWGIIGALIFRAIFVLIGASLFHASPWVGFIFAAFVIWSAIQMLRADNDNEVIEDYSDHWSVRLTHKLFPVYPKLYGEQFVVHKSKIAEAPDDLEKEDEKHLTKGNEKSLFSKIGGYYATPALLCLMAIETSDVAFAFDSVPAIIAVTHEPMLVYAAMIFAILGLRSLYFVLAALTKYLVHLETAVIGLLFFIGAKMLLESVNKTIGDTGIHISAGFSLAVVLLALVGGVVASFIWPDKEEAEAMSEAATTPDELPENQTQPQTSVTPETPAANQNQPENDPTKK